MKEIWVRRTYTIIGGIKTDPKDGPFHFRFSSPHLFDGHAEIDAEGKSLVVEGRIKISDELFDAVQQEQLDEHISESLELELQVLRWSQIEAARRVVRLVQQELLDLLLLPANELSIQSEKDLWSTDGKEWKAMGGQKMYAVAEVRHPGRLTEEIRATTQDLLERGETPLLAMQHLYEAARSDGLRFKWIEATIAAELAIKEILIRIEPKLSVVLVELPSPPLRKLYGEVLESVAGQKSPFRRELHHGSEIRNRLVHRPGAEDLDPQQVFNYIETVRKAIQHLLELSRNLAEAGR